LAEEEHDLVLIGGRDEPGRALIKGLTAQCFNSRRNSEREGDLINRALNFVSGRDEAANKALLCV
jgi:hypothetical protein